MLTFTGCGGENSSTDKKNSTPEKVSEQTSSNAEKISGKVLVAYFSRADDNYNVGIIEKGNTKIIAEIIAEKTGADIFEIKPVKSYPVDYKECTEIAKTEKENNARPEILEPLPNIQDYDTIFLGYPIWWGDLPMLLYTFIEKENFAGKTIIPFCTHEGSGLGGTESFIAKKIPDAKVLQGLAIRGSVAQNEQDKAKSDIENWLKDFSD